MNNIDGSHQGENLSIDRPITRNDVARLAGVSTATVSYVINDGPRRVSPETRAKVLEAISRLGYRPNKVAQNLRRQKTSMIGLIIPDTANPYFSEVSRGVEQVAFENGCTVVLCHSDYEVDRELKYVEILLAERCAGVLWIPASESKQAGEAFVKYGMPLIILDRVPEGLDAPRVVVDNFRGGYIATDYLIGLGHQRIGFISRPETSHHSQERLRGYLAALRDANIEVDKSLIVEAHTFRLDGGRRAAEVLLSHPEPPTAIFAYTDVMALGALRGIYEMGFKIPDDISLVGFDGTEQAAFACPSLTTVHQPKMEMGCKGAELLLSLIKNGERVVDSPKPLDVELIIRESTAVLKRMLSDDSK